MCSFNFVHCNKMFTVKNYIKLLVKLLLVCNLHLQYVYCINEYGILLETKHPVISVFVY